MLRIVESQQNQLRSDQLKIGVALDELFGAVILEADREAAVFPFSLYTSDGADAVLRMADARAEERIFGAAGRAA